MREALLVLEDGSTFRGRAFGAEGEAFGEAVFNTAMSGYQEVLTDPSYAGQIVTMTSPHQGNYGVNDEDRESRDVQVAGFVIREASRRASSWRSRTTLAEYLEAAGVVGVEGIDTRRLTRRIREAGAMRAGISTLDLDPESLGARVRAQPTMEGADLASSVSTARVVSAAESIGPPRQTHRTFRVAAYDYGIKWNILRNLAESGCDTELFPAHTPASELLKGGFDGVFLSNGPGDPAATTYGVDAVRTLIGKLPIFAICLGHQLLALALGGRTYKLRFGHRGVNQPVKDLDTGRIEITSHNHGFAVDPDGWTRNRPAGDRPVEVESAFGRVALTHWNLNDGTLEGLRCIDVPAFSVQYHPEASPGPHDSGHLFRRFLDLMS
ncbi:MAG TPA: glutamine-hydrolyzing carbamoyl-phosphate synthase small subunit [Actinomycetota bacterium]|nr:glutamine-hydrolyzing carbamoyl-phosphate synthase small subunit [Actinomycetota bacterium]